MKKTYLQPSTKMVIIGAVTMVCASQGVTSTDKDIDYGGVDEDGELDPASRRRRDVWEDEELEEEEIEEF